MSLETFFWPNVNVLKTLNNLKPFEGLMICFCVTSGFALPSWVHTKGQGKGALIPSPQSESPESTVIEVEDIPALLRDVARFAEAVEKLKDVVLTEGKIQFVERLQTNYKSTLKKGSKYLHSPVKMS